MKKKERTIALFLGMILVLLIVTAVLSADLVIERWLIGSGGGRVQGSDQRLLSAIGQPAAGSANNGYTLHSGFFMEGEATGMGEYHNMLPIVLTKK